MSVPNEVLQLDEQRRRGDITWDQYKKLLKGAFAMAPADLFSEMGAGRRDRHGRLSDLEHVTGNSPGDT